MSDIINAFHRKHRRDERIKGRLYRMPVQKIRCADGFAISVQANSHTYCEPRETADIEYRKFECGYPSGPVPELAEWKDGDGQDEECVYGYVPVEAIVALIEKHGGISEAA